MVSAAVHALRHMRAGRIAAQPLTHSKEQTVMEPGDADRYSQKHLFRCVKRAALIVTSIWLCWGSAVAAADFGALQETEHYCGPDLTDWMLEEMNINAASEEIAYIYETSRPPTLRSTVERMVIFAELVGPRKQWDHKPPILDMLAEGLQDGTCPTSLCSRTITLCGACYNFDVFSNIHYGYIGRVAGFNRSVLLIAPVFVQSGETPCDKIRGEAEDSPAILVGQDVYRQVWFQRLLDPANNPWPGWVTRAMLCDAIERRSSRLADRFVDPECMPCEYVWLP